MGTATPEGRVVAIEILWWPGSRRLYVVVGKDFSEEIPVAVVSLSLPSRGAYAGNSAVRKTYGTPPGGFGGVGSPPKESTWPWGRRRLTKTDELLVWLPHTGAYDRGCYDTGFDMRPQ